jgi:nucleoside-diphosphate-sugar epimerase
MNEHNNTIVITGGSGLIGTALAQRFSQRFRIVNLDRKEPPQLLPATEFVPIDLTSGESVENALHQVRTRSGEHISSVLHLAAYYDFSGEPNPLYEEVTLRGTERLLRGLEPFRVGQFVFSSSMLVHSPCQPGERINEEWPLDPRWPYPESKVKTEELLRAQHGDIPLAILRMAGVYDDRCHSPPLAQQIRRIYERQLISRVFPGDLSHGQSFVHLEDVVEAFWRVVERRDRLPAEAVLLLGEPDPLSYNDLQRAFGRLLHSEEWETMSIPKALAKAGAWIQDTVPVGEEPFIKPRMIDFADDHYALDISRAHQVLGWEPGRSLQETLPKMVNALKEDPVGWYQEHGLEPPSWLQERAAKTG